MNYVSAVLLWFGAGWAYGDGNERTRSGMSKSGTGHDELLSAHEGRWIRRLAAYCWQLLYSAV